MGYNESIFIEDSDLWVDFNRVNAKINKIPIITIPGVNTNHNSNGSCRISAFTCSTQNNSLQRIKTRATKIIDPIKNGPKIEDFNFRDSFFEFFTGWDKDHLTPYT